MNNTERLARIDAIHAAAEAEHRELTDSELQETERLADECYAALD